MANWGDQYYEEMYSIAFSTFDELTRYIDRQKLIRNYNRIDTLAPEKINTALARFCDKKCGIAPVWLPNFRHALDTTATRKLIAQHLLELDDDVSI